MKCVFQEVWSMSSNQMKVFNYQSVFGSALKSFILENKVWDFPIPLSRKT